MEPERDVPIPPDERAFAWFAIGSFCILAGAGLLMIAVVGDSNDLCGERGPWERWSPWLIAAGGVVATLVLAWRLRPRWLWPALAIALVVQVTLYAAVIDAPGVC